MKMNKKYTPVKNHRKIVRDKESRAVVNINQNEFQHRLRVKARQNEVEYKINRLEQTIIELQNSLKNR